jgi:hypothetical protein
VIELRAAIRLVKEMFRPAELIERIRRLVHGRPIGVQSLHAE